MKLKNIRRGVVSFASTVSIAVISFLLATGCDNKDYSKDSPFDNAVYIDAAQVKDVSNFTFNNTVETGQREIAAMLAYPAGQDVDVSFRADPSLASRYNARFGTSYTVLDTKYYKLSGQQVVIPQGDVASNPVTIDFSGLTGLEIDAGYLLPITIDRASEGMNILDGSRTVYYVVRRSSAITTAVSLANNYFEVPGFDKGSPTANVVNNLKKLTFEAIIRVNKFEGTISSIMGIEQYCLLRIGDAGFPRQQLQFTMNENKFPKADNTKLLQPGEWYHVAVTYDTENKTAVMYVDGREYSRITDYGKGEPVNLGQQERGKHFMFKIGHSYGESNDMSRQLDGEICEVRVWNVLRTQEEIYKNMYDVDPGTPGLQAYWKFNEGEGNEVKDYTGNGNDAVAYGNAMWPDGIEIPQKNRE